MGYSEKEFYLDRSMEPMRASVTHNAGTPRHHLDATERRMVELLQQDGRLSVAQLARLLHVTQVTARRKLKRLLGDGIIRVVATVDPFDVGYETPVIIGLKVRRGQLDAVAERLSSLPQVRYVGASTGRVDLIVEVVTRINQDLAEFLLNELAHLEGITDSETNLIVRIYKQSWDWGIRDESESPRADPAAARGRPR
jgi:Lrp/AsnC family transcriptional regulator, regulator for asnA, asnC and gidA